MARDFNNEKVDGLLSPTGLASVSRLFSMRAVKKKLISQVADISRAFIVPLQEGEVYMEPPPGYIEKYGDCLWRLKHMAYGQRESAVLFQDFLADIFVKRDEVCSINSRSDNVFLPQGKASVGRRPR